VPSSIAQEAARVRALIEERRGGDGSGAAPGRGRKRRVADSRLKRICGFSSYTSRDDKAGASRRWMMSSSAPCRTAVVALLVALTSCGEGLGPHGPTTPPPTATPTPAPGPAGTIRLIGSSLPDGSTVKVMPMFVIGQQAPQLSFTAGITMRESLTEGLVRAWVRTETQRCMGGGQAGVDFQAGVERGVAPASMSHPGQGMALCALPYTTTQVEFEVIGSDADHPLLVQRFPAVYHFVE